MNQTSNGSFKNNTESNIKMLLKTPFQKYIEQKSKKVSLNNTMTNFKESMTSRQKSTLMSQNSRNNFNFTSTAFNSPKNISPIKHS
jgi:phage FluMu protein Com